MYANLDSCYLKRCRLYSIWKDNTLDSWHSPSFTKFSNLAIPSTMYSSSFRNNFPQKQLGWIQLLTNNFNHVKIVMVFKKWIKKGRKNKRCCQTYPTAQVASKCICSPCKFEQLSSHRLSPHNSMILPQKIYFKMYSWHIPSQAGMDSHHL